MTTPVVVTDVPAKIRGRCANVSIHGQVMSISFRSHDPVLVPLADASKVVIGEQRIGVCLHVPRTLVPGFKSHFSSFIIEGKCDTLADHLLLHHAAVDTRPIRCMKTACERAYLHVMPDLSVWVWSKNECTHVPNPHTVVLQRTKGGMSTYDVHVLHAGSERVTTVEMLPHTTLSQWESMFGAERVYDAGAAPICTKALVMLYNETSSWSDVIRTFTEASDVSEPDDADSDPDYHSGSSSSSSSEEELIDVFSETDGSSGESESMDDD